MYREVGALSVVLALMVGCGEEAETGPWEEPDCPAPEEIVRMDCPYNGEIFTALTIKQPKDFEPICQSPCKQLWRNLILDGERTYSLAPLSHLTEIGALEIRNKSMPNLKGLENVKEIDSIYAIGSGLLNFEGLEDLEFAIDIYIEGNPKLQTLKGFEGLKELRGGAHGLKVAENPSLKKVGSFDQLKKSKLGVNFYYNTSLVEVDGFRSIDDVNATVYFGLHENLERLNGLEEMKAVDYLSFDSNEKLTQCEIERVKQSIEVINNNFNQFNGPEGPCPQ